MAKKKSNRLDLDPKVVFPFLIDRGYREAAVHFECSRGKLWSLIKKNKTLYDFYEKLAKDAGKTITAAPPESKLTAGDSKQVRVKNKVMAPRKASFPVRTNAETHSSSGEAKSGLLWRKAKSIGGSLVMDKYDYVSGAVVLGYYFICLKATLSHGEWETSIAENYKQHTIKTAQRYMGVAHHILTAKCFKSDTVSFFLSSLEVPKLVLDNIRTKTIAKTLSSLYRDAGIDKRRKV